MGASLRFFVPEVPNPSQSIHPSTSTSWTLGEGSFLEGALLELVLEQPKRDETRQESHPIESGQGPVTMGDMAGFMACA